ncbi:hypothetical protein CLV78_10635 [Aliiruegeria haliotis]|uniref:Uncharacterized protein n=1 Tax=Aliiruegeria haliotis TaxID=1280846 RepID=A0A2T0RMS5_9RHOB|nr:hypothetical protein [Aliiruegeria haliotis]PRY22495.1 hypothetical protein CLV78_10635 [Aliiruegeria haliotis]
MANRAPISVVKTAQTANTLKLVRDGKVVASVVISDDATAELLDHRDHRIGRFHDAPAAIAEFEKITSFEEIELDF